MIDYLHKTTGKILDNWIKIATQNNFSTHVEIISLLKQNQGLPYGDTNYVARVLQKKVTCRNATFSYKITKIMDFPDAARCHAAGSACNANFLLNNEYTRTCN